MSNEPFAFARNLKIFIIVLCCLPLVGIAMFFLLPQSLNGFDIAVAPHIDTGLDYRYLVEYIDNGGGEGDETTDKVMLSLVGDIKKTYQINPSYGIDDGSIYLVNPSTVGIDGSVAVELFVLDYSYCHKEIEEVDASKLDISKLGALEEGQHYGYMTCTLENSRRIVFLYDYVTGAISEYNGDADFLNIAKLAIEIGEDTITTRLISTEYADITVTTNGKGFYNADGTEIKSRILPGGFADRYSENYSEIYEKWAYSGETAEKGGVFQISADGAFSDISSVSVGIVNIERDIESEDPYPSFCINIKLYYDYGK